MVFKLSSISSEKGEKINAGMKINISRIVVTEVAGFGKAVTIYQGEKAYSTFSKAVTAKCEAMLEAIPHDESGRLQDIIPVEVYERLSKDRRTYLDLKDME